jgi:uncharacterized membrane protein
MIVAVILVLYGVANATLWHTIGGYHYVDTDLFYIITSIFAFMIILSLPRTVEILLGRESQPPKARYTTTKYQTLNAVLSFDRRIEASYSIHILRQSRLALPFSPL